jgi:uncharacterized protein YndB with AHSA1/START domain
MFLNLALMSVGVIVFAVVVLVVVAAMKPDAFRVERSATFTAPAEKVFPHLNDFHNWPTWSPWEKLDPAQKRTHSGATSGKGAVYEWEGNKKVGQGRMEITESTFPSKITIQLDFIKPFSANNITVFTVAGQGGTTTVTWTMTGRQPFMFKVMALFMSMDKMIGKDFEAGLAAMKGVVE